MRSIWKWNSYNAKIKLRFYKSNIGSILLYAPVIWASQIKKKVNSRGSKGRFFRRILGIWSEQRVTNREMMGRAGINHIVEEIKIRAACSAVGDNKTTYSVSKLLNELQWLTLEERRKRAKGKAQGYSSARGHYLWLLGFNNNQEKDKGTPTKIYMASRPRIQCHEHWFFPSVIRLWNNLTPGVAKADNADQFKVRLSATVFLPYSRKLRQ